MDSGNQYAPHVQGAHAEMQEERWKSLGVGSLTFDSDDLWCPLQVADVVSWASRVRAQGDEFTNGYEPLNAIFDDAHAQEPLTPKYLSDLATDLTAIQESGASPDLLPRP